MNEDWVDDSALSGDEIKARFEARGPAPTVGPRIPAGGRLTTAPTYGGRTVTKSVDVSSGQPQHVA